MCIALLPQVQQLSLQDMTRMTTGHVINLISNDVQRLDRAVRALPSIVLATFALLVSDAILFYFIGWPTIIGNAYLLVLLVYQGIGSKLATNLRHKAVALADQRVKIINEIIRGIRTIKTSGWEKHFENVVSRLRGSVNFF